MTGAGGDIENSAGLKQIADLLQAAQKEPEARRAKFDELRRTLQYVEASRACATKPMVFF